MTTLPKEEATKSSLLCRKHVDMEEEKEKSRLVGVSQAAQEIGDTDEREIAQPEGSKSNPYRSLLRQESNASTESESNRASSLLAASTGGETHLFSKCFVTASSRESTVLVYDQDLRNEAAHSPGRRKWSETHKEEEEEEEGEKDEIVLSLPNKLENRELLDLLKKLQETPALQKQAVDALRSICASAAGNSHPSSTQQPSSSPVTCSQEEHKESIVTGCTTAQFSTNITTGLEGSPNHHHRVVRQQPSTSANRRVEISEEIVTVPMHSPPVNAFCGQPGEGEVGGREVSSMWDEIPKEEKVVEGVEENGGLGQVLHHTSEGRKLIAPVQCSNVQYPEPLISDSTHLIMPCTLHKLDGKHGKGLYKYIKRNSKKCSIECEKLFLPYACNKDGSHGLALIIVNGEFRRHPQHPEKKQLKSREAAKDDLRRLRKIWHQLNYRVLIKENCSAEEIHSLFDSVIREGGDDTIQTGDDSFVCCVSSHGGLDPTLGTDVVFGAEGARVKDADGKVIMKGAVDMKALAHEKLSPKKCPQLMGCPKLFFIQACRGSGKESLGSGNESLVAVEEEASRYTPPSEVDFLFAYATALGLKSYRNEIEQKDLPKGSFFITGLYDMLLKNARILPLTAVLAGICRKETVREPYELEGQRLVRQTPNFTHSLQGPVFFTSEARDLYNKNVVRQTIP